MKNIEVSTNNHQISKRGFTLVELLVVISIIALLLAVLMPALQKARAQGQRAVCLANLHQVSLGVSMYAGEYRDWLPGNWGETGWKGWVSQSRYMIRTGLYLNHGLLLPYLGTRPNVLWCPAGPKSIYELWKKYANDNNYVLYSHYSMRALITSADLNNNRITTPSQLTDMSFAKLSGKKSSSKGLMADTSTQLDYEPFYADVKTKCKIDSKQKYYGAWHRDSYPTLYYDGHAKSLRSDVKKLIGTSERSMGWASDNTTFWNYADNN